MEHHLQGSILEDVHHLDSVSIVLEGMMDLLIITPSINSSVTLEWTQLTTPDSSSGPMKKTGCGMIAYNGCLVLIGGHGFPCGPIQPGAEFVKNDRSTDSSGWSNELHVFDVRKGEAVLVHITANVELLLVLHGLVFVP